MRMFLLESLTIPTLCKGIEVEVNHPAETAKEVDMAASVQREYSLF
jgi:hypothetical protein